MMYSHALCGWRVCSDLPIPELPQFPEAGISTGPSDITVTVGPVSEELDDPIGLNGFLKVGRDGTVLMKVAEDLRFLVTGGRDVTVEFRSELGRETWRLYFLGTILHYICHQRGTYPLHAACLSIAGKTVAIAGHSGDGKSTLAYELLRRGHHLLSDDLTVLQSEGEDIRVVPAYPRLRLWRESLVAAGTDTDGLLRVRPDMDKFVIEPRGGFDPAPTKLAAVVVITAERDFDLKRYGPAEAVTLLLPHICRPKVAALLGRQADLLRFTARIAVQSPVYQLKRPKRFDRLADVATAIEGLMG